MMSRSVATLFSMFLCSTLTTTRWPSRKRARVDLPDRRRCERLILELDKQLLDGSMQLGLDESANYVGRIGRRIGLQRRQLLSQDGTDDIGAHAENLSELDESGAHLGQGHANAYLGGQSGNRLAVEASEKLAHEANVDRLEPVGQAVFTQNGDDVSQSAGGSLPSGKGRKVHNGFRFSVFGFRNQLSVYSIPQTVIRKLKTENRSWHRMQGDVAGLDRQIGCRLFRPAAGVSVANAVLHL